MYEIKYRIKNLSPVVISTKFGDMNMVNTERYIPGSSVLGILAKRYIQKNKIRNFAHKNERFYNWFLAGSVRINNAYIYSLDEYNHEYIHYPIPLSIKKEKTGDRVFDFLHAEIDDDIQMESIESFGFLDGNTLQLKNVETNLNFHHARDREKGISKEGIIFNYESISPNQVFAGNIVGQKEDLEKIIDELGNEQEWFAYLGRSKNNQYGKVKFEFLSDNPELLHDEIKSSDSKEISLTFLSNTIIYNENGFPCTSIEWLEKYLDIKIKKAFVKIGDAENFVGVWRLKKPSEKCFMAGSTFLIEITNSNKEKLNRFQIEGIGARTHEGFGNCIFEWQTAEELKILIESEDDSFIQRDMPHISIPTKTKEILKTLATNYIKKQVQLMAMRDQDEFSKSSNIPTPSLIGKLESIAKNNAPKEFIIIIKQFRKSAKDKLEHCHNRRENLYEFIINRKITTREILRLPKNMNLNKMCEEIDFKLEEEKGLENELYNLYFTTFFSMMRKAAKIKQ